MVAGRIVADTGLEESEIERSVFKLFKNVPSVEEDIALAEDDVTGNLVKLQDNKQQ